MPILSTGIWQDFSHAHISTFLPDWAYFVQRALLSSYSKVRNSSTCMFIDFWYFFPPV